MTRYILDLVDFDNDFVRSNGALYVPEAEGLIAKANDFLNRIRPRLFDFVLVKYDTHFSGEYPHSPESIPFPNIHCEYGTWGWQQAIDLKRVDWSIPVYYMTKNAFDMWGSNPVGKADTIAFKNDAERRAYLNLFHVTDDEACLKPGTPRDEFMAQNNVGSDTIVVMAGVASNFCDFDAMLGYLQRGCKLIVLEDLMRGIPHGPEGRKFHLETFGIDRTATGDIRDVVQTLHFKPYLDSGQLQVMTSDDFLKLTAVPQPKPGPKPQP